MARRPRQAAERPFAEGNFPTTWQSAQAWERLARELTVEGYYAAVGAWWRIYTSAWLTVTRQDARTIVPELPDILEALQRVGLLDRRWRLQVVLFDAFVGAAIDRRRGARDRKRLSRAGGEGVDNSPESVDNPPAEADDASGLLRPLAASDVPLRPRLVHVTRTEHDPGPLSRVTPRDSAGLKQAGSSTRNQESLTEGGPGGGLANTTGAIASAWESACGRTLIGSGVFAATYLDDAASRHPEATVLEAIALARGRFEHIPSTQALAAAVRGVLDPLLPAAAAGAKPRRARGYLPTTEEMDRAFDR